MPGGSSPWGVAACAARHPAASNGTPGPVPVHCVVSLSIVALPSPRQAAEADQASAEHQERSRLRRDKHPNAAGWANAVGGRSEAAAKRNEDFTRDGVHRDRMVSGSRAHILEEVLGQPVEPAKNV